MQTLFKPIANYSFRKGVYVPKPALRCFYSKKVSDSTPTIRHLLQTMSSKDDVDEYLRVYGTPGVRRTAVIKIGGEVLDNELDVLVNSLVYLKEAGLHPILIHGAGPQMNVALKKSGEEPQYVKGMRVTTSSTLAVAKKVFHDANLKLVEAIIRGGAAARPITSGVFEANVKDLDTLGYVGEVSNVSTAAVQSAVSLSEIPVISCLGESLNGQLLNINADVAARELAMKLKPHKTIFINAKGGWIEDDGNKLEKINMKEDFERMASRDYTGRQGTLLKLNEIKLLLDALPRSSSVVLTSASALSREVLSNCSSGTVCIHGGEPANVSGAWIGSSSGTDSKRFKVGLLGARGYVGREVIRAIGKHPHLDLICASSRALEGSSVLDIANAPPINPHSNLPATSVDNSHVLNIDPELNFCSLSADQLGTSSIAKDVDVWVLALPNGHSNNYVNHLLSLRRDSPLLIDLSADQRFNDNWVYGLPESPEARYRLRNAKLISNPGCYATGAQIGLLPLFSKLGLSRNIQVNPTIPPNVFGVSGYSGAGTGLSDNNNPSVLKNNIIAYKSVQHIHENEISRHLGAPIAFMPHVAPFFQGIHLTISAHLSAGVVPTETIQSLYQDYYKEEPFVNVVDNIPKVRDNAKQNHVTVGGIQVDETSGRLVVISTIDNLLKGAATQAVQNINIALDMNEQSGIGEEFH